MHGRVFLSMIRLSSTVNRAEYLHTTDNNEQKREHDQHHPNAIRGIHILGISSKDGATIRVEQRGNFIHRTIGERPYIDVTVAMNRARAPNSSGILNGRGRFFCKAVLMLTSRCFLRVSTSTVIVEIIACGIQKGRRHTCLSILERCIEYCCCNC